jgi:hypothetical protein
MVMNWGRGGFQKDEDGEIYQKDRINSCRPYKKRWFFSPITIHPSEFQSGGAAFSESYIKD